MDKIREQYQAHKNEEEERKIRYRDSPHVGHKEMGDQSGANGENTSLTSSQTPEASPVPVQRGIPPQGNVRETSPVPNNPPVPSTPTHVLPAQPVPLPVLPPANQPPLMMREAPVSPGIQQPPPPPPPLAEKREISPALGNSAKSSSPQDGDVLFQYAWFHGPITREEATARLDKFGGYDG